MFVDLHLHSRWSDGLSWPDRIVADAKRAGLEGVAITDHDTLGGAAEFLAAADAAGLAAWPGVEIDCRIKDLGFRGELLAYFPTARPQTTVALLAGILGLRRERAKAHLGDARRIFGRPDLGFEDMEAFRSGGRVVYDAAALSWSKLDVFRYLVAKDVLPADAKYREFRAAFFDTGLLREGSYRKPELRGIMAAVRSDGGFASIPHPAHAFGDDPARLRGEAERARALWRRFREEGVEGIEMYAYAEPVRDALNRVVLEIARPLGLVPTWGSDSHGPGSGRIELGEFRGTFDGFPGRPAVRQAQGAG